MRKLWLKVAGVVMLGVALIVSINLFAPTPDRYSGKAIFYTEDEYRQFKIEVARPEVHLEGITVLASEPPIVVDFSVSVSDGSEFNFGKRNYTSDVLYSFLVLVILAITAAFIL